MGTFRTGIALTGTSKSAGSLVSSLGRAGRLGCRALLATLLGCSGGFNERSISTVMNCSRRCFG